MKSQLMTIPGIGPAKAAAIIAYRDEHGLFKRRQNHYEDFRNWTKNL